MIAEKPSYLHNASGPVSKIKTVIYIAIGSAFGLGLSPVAPGTFGALIGVGIHIFIVFFLPPEFQVFALAVSLAVIIAANHLLTPWARAYWQNEDPRHFVLDEIAGYLLVPILFHQGKLWQIVVWGFLLFRILDIIKLPPARQIDRNMNNSWGIMLDDLVSAVYAVLILYLFAWLGPKLGLEQWLIYPG